MLVTLRGRRRLDRVLRTALAALSLAFLPLTTEGQETGAAAGEKKLAEPIAKGQRVFSCGHSFHFWVPGIVKDLAKKAGIDGHQQLGVSSIGGSRVIQHWDLPDDKFTSKETLATGKVEVLTLSPIFLPDPGIENFATLALEKNPDVRVIVQPIWLRFDIYEPTAKRRPEKVDHNAITGEELRQRHAEHFQKMDEHIRELNKKYGKTVLYIAPAPQAVIALREKIIAGEAPGLKQQEDLFTDALGHGKPPLMAIVGYVNYATIYRRSPVGLPVPEILKQAKLGHDEEKLNRLLQQLAWDAVTQHPLSGVTTSPTTAKAEPNLKPNAESAVKAGVGYLSQQQQMDGSWKVEPAQFKDGVSALCSIALLNGGVTADDDRMKRALQWLRQQNPQGTYSLALQTVAFSQARAPEDVERLKKNVAWLVSAQAKDGGGKGGWSYVAQSAGRADGSCTRFAVWALEAARRADVAVPEATWRATAEYWLSSQLEDGAWGYTTTTKPGTATMTLAGISCLGAINAAVADDTLRARINESIERAWKRHTGYCEGLQPTYLKKVGFPCYAHQSLGQAVRRSSGLKTGDADWMSLSHQILLQDQNREKGSWSGDKAFGEAEPLISTSLALLSLAEK
jgi:hypothetical protein